MRSVGSRPRVFGGETWGRGGEGGYGRVTGGGWGERDSLDDIELGRAGPRTTGLEHRRDELDEQVVEQFFAAGDRVLHATLGEGVVIAVEHGGIVAVRFENDGSERRLMGSVAPLKKLRG